jgi:hypothetical protein
MELARESGRDGETETEKERWEENAKAGRQQERQNAKISQWTEKRSLARKNARTFRSGKANATVCQSGRKPAWESGQRVWGIEGWVWKRSP